MSKLLKEAIADAGLVRETALANAKLALEEAFTPTIQSMLSKKIQSEVEGEEDEVAVEDEEAGEEVAVEDEEGGEEEVAPEAELDIPADEVPAEEGEVSDDEVAVEDEELGDDEVAVEDEELGDDEVAVEDEEAGEEDLDLEAILRELEDGVDEEGDEPVEEGDEEEAAYDEGDEVEDVTSADEDEEAGVEEELDLESVLKALSEEDGDDDDDDDEVEVEEVVNLRNELEEHKDCINKLRSELNEINLLNAKLLFTNKLFKSYDLDNSGKLRVVEMFDRTKNIREIKLVYATLQESLKTGGATKKVSKPITEGLASKPVASTKSSKKDVVSDGDAFANRLKKLAGIK